LTALSQILNSFRAASKTEREKGTYFEELIVLYLTHEPKFKDLYSKVCLYSEWAKDQGQKAHDTGIDLVAESRTGEIHAVQCKLYSPDYRLQKSDIDSFFTASGKKPFTHRIIFSTTNLWSRHAEDALQDQQPPVTKIDLQALEESQIDWVAYAPAQGGKKTVSLKAKKTPRPHQKYAIENVRNHFKTYERGKLIMACGTGKTYTSLKIAEEMAGKGGRVLFLVPSLSLLSQTLTEWTQESEIPLHSFAVCSDSDVGKNSVYDEDTVQVLTHELRFPATTDAKSLAREVANCHDKAHMSVVFSTYHSIEVISKAQKNNGLEPFDIIICDEAHRTTGATFGDEIESNFVKVHDAKFLKAEKRLYMTATPRIYADSAKAMAEKDNVAICSMDDEELYGPQFHVLTFSEAVTQGLLVDYKVIVLSVNTDVVNERLQDLLKDENNQLKVDDAAKIVGCWKALSKQDLTKDLLEDGLPMRRAVAFCQVIEPSTKARAHKVSSKNIAGVFEAVVEEYKKKDVGDLASSLVCKAKHVDGSMNASTKAELLDWLKAESEENTCQILSNVRCLSEGVDVPSLDAVLFLTPRNSQVDVVQSVGRVMRKAPGKKRGYIILPVVIPSDTTPEQALNDNKTYRVVWEVLQALRSHDDRFDAMINKLDLIGKDPSKMEVIAVTEKIAKKGKSSDTNSSESKAEKARGGSTIGSTQPKARDSVPVPMKFEIGELERAIYAKVVQKCGNRHHWEDWANDIAKIARTHIERIGAILKNPKYTREQEAFARFASELRDDLNDSITDAEVIEMLAQHLITKPVFEALFAGYSFASQNPISLAMQGVLDVLNEHRLDKEADTLNRFYASVKQRADGIENAQGKQKIVVELYDKFFRNAFPKMTERLGIVYTPVEVVDFIIHSVNHLLQTEFRQTLGSKGVHIIDPFTGTGTFITRLMQSGVIKPEELAHKYKHEIHANEIVLLAYYIAAINIEAVYHSLMGGNYVPFEGICLTDTFQLYEKEDLVSQMLVDNSARRKRQKALDIRVIIGNPPYSVGQDNANDNNANVVYPTLDDRIRSTYVARSNATNKNGLYNSYIRAIRWASDRVGKSGIVGFVTNAGFLEANIGDGLRKCLAEEFSSIHVFHLRGNQRTQGEMSRREGGKIFGSGSRAPIAISFLAKNPAAKKQGQIFFHDIGDYLSQAEKLQKIADFGSVTGISSTDGWQSITPDEHGDWLKQRDGTFEKFITLGDKDGLEAKKLFENFTRGVATARDAWCVNYSGSSLTANIKRMGAFYNSEVERFYRAYSKLEKKRREPLVDKFIDFDATKISWNRSLKQELVKERRFEFEHLSVRKSFYRPFTKQTMYFNRQLNDMIYQMPRIFPDAKADNLAIILPGPGEDRPFSVLMVNSITDLHFIHGGQGFPLFLYDDPKEDDEEPNLLAKKAQEGRTRRDAITKEGLAHFQAAHPGEKLTSEDIFYYVYGLLHSPEYRERYADNLSKELPRIPCVKKASDFWAFSKAGRDLAKLHLDYEKVKPYAVKVDMTDAGRGVKPENYYRVEKMRYGKTKIDGKSADDKTVLVYNDFITLREIPLRAYEYVVNGKSALDWVVERQCVKTDKDSGIVNDANDWANETIGDPKYPLDLFKRVITVSLGTLDIVESLPKLDF
jgi:predicted helicase